MGCTEAFGCRGLGVTRLGAFFEAIHSGSLAPEMSSILDHCSCSSWAAYFVLACID